MRILLQDFTGVRAVVDLAAMCDAVETLGDDPASINALVPIGLVIDRLVVAEVADTPEPFGRNAELKF